MEQEEMPVMLFTIVIALIVMMVGFFAFFYVVNSANESVEISKTETFQVTDPSVDQTFTLSSHAEEETAVITQWTGFEWISVDPSYVSWDGKKVTIQEEGLLG